MSNYVTVVIRMPEGDAERKKVSEILKSLEPYRTAMSLEDEMTVLEMIEQHEDFDASIADQARTKTLELHRKVEAVN